MQIMETYFPKQHKSIFIDFDMLVPDYIWAFTTLVDAPANLVLETSLIIWMLKWEQEYFVFSKPN